MNGQTMYQKNVHDPLTYPYKFIKPDTGSKLGKRVRKGKWKGMKFYTLTFDDRPSVIRMWKEHGFTVADVGNGVEF